MASSKASLPPLPQLVAQRVDYLLALAAATVKGDSKRAIRYVDLAVRLSSRHRLPLGRVRKRLFCASCHLPWIAGHNLAIRLRPRTKRAEYRCACGESRFFAYSTKKTKTNAPAPGARPSASSSPRPASSAAGGQLVRQPFKRNWC